MLQIFIVFSLVALGFMGYWVYLQNQQLKQLKHKIDLLSLEQNALINGSLGLGRKLFQFKSNLSQLEQAQQAIKVIEESDKSFDQAARMFKMGSSIEEVVESCHLSQGEAQLLKDMISQESFS